MNFYSQTMRRTFDNDMTAYFLPRPGRAVEAECYIRTGSVHEEEFLGYGVSHFLEHMLFQGCAGYPEQSAADTVRRLGGSINACTGPEFTMVNVNIPAEHLAEVLELVSAMVRTPELPEPKFELEKQVILRECAMTRDRVGDRLVHEMLKTVFPNHPLRHPVCGYPELVAECRCDMLKKYHHRRYTPERCFWVLTGGFDPAAAAERLEKCCGDWKRGDLAEPVLAVEPPPRTSRSGEIVFPDPLARLALALRIPDDGELFDAAELLFGTLGMGESSRLVRKLELEENLAQNVGASCFSICNTNLGEVGAAAVPAKLEKLEKRLFEELEKVKNGDLDRSAVERERVQKYAELLRQTDDPRSIALNIGGAVLGGEPPEECDRRIARLSALTYENVREAAKLLDRNNITVVRQYPETKLAASPRTVRRTPELNALAPHLLHAPDRGVPLARLALSLPGGTLFENAPGASAMAAAWFAAGTRRRTEAEFWEKLEGCGAELGILPGLNSISIALSAPRRYFRKAVELLGEALCRPRFGEAEFEREREHLIENCRCRESSPLDAAMERALAALFGPHPYGRNRNGSMDALRKIAPQQVRDFHLGMLDKTRIAAAFGGDCRADEAEKFMAALFGRAEQTGKKLELPAEPRFPDRPERIDFELPREQTAVVLALPGMRLDDFLDRRIDILQYCENGLSSRLFHRVREDNALSYSVGMTLNGGFHRGSFVFYALTEAKGAERTLELIREEVARLADDGVEKVEFDAAREAAAFKADAAVESMKSLLEGAALDLYYGVPPERILTRGDELRTVKLDEFNALLRERFADALEHSVTAIARGTAGK